MLLVSSGYIHVFTTLKFDFFVPGHTILLFCHNQVNYNMFPPIFLVLVPASPREGQYTLYTSPHLGQYLLLL